eukprot:3279740-Prymnesium_polylepis.3
MIASDGRTSLWTAPGMMIAVLSDPGDRPPQWRTERGQPAQPSAGQSQTARLQLSCPRKWAPRAARAS